MKKITLEDIKKELEVLNLTLVSNEYVKWKVLKVICECGREFKAKIYDIRKGKRCFYCNNKHLLNNKFNFQNKKEIREYLKNPILFELKQDKNKWKRYKALKGIPLNILEQIKLFINKNYSDFQISSRIRQYNNYIISRSKIKNLRKFL